MTVRLTEAQKIKVLNGADLYAIMQQVLLREKKIDRGKEHVWVVALAQNNRILMIELVSLGSPRQAVVEPVDVFSFALQKQAMKIILVHNHPSGELSPSPADQLLTTQMLSVGELVRCQLLDHLIISETGYYSFEESGLLKQLARRATDLNFKELKKLQQLVQIRDEQLQKQGAELEQKGAELEEKNRHIAELENKAREMAAKLLERGFSIAEIAGLTGLAEEAVAALATKP